MDAAGQQEVLLLEDEVEPTTTTVRRRGWDRAVVGPLVVVLIAAASLVVWAARGTWGTGAPESPASDASQASAGTSTPVPSAASQDGVSSVEREDAPGGGSDETADRESVARGPGSPDAYDLLIATPIVDIEDALFTSVASPIGQLDQGQIWIAVSRQAGVNELMDTFYLVDLQTGALMDEQTADDFYSLHTGVGPSGPSGLVNGPAGGIYETSEEGFRLAVEGRLITADSRRALVQSCDAELDCTLTWFDRRSWRPVDLVVPDSAAGGAILVAGTDWVLSKMGSTGNEPAELTHVVTGEVVELHQSNQWAGGSVVLPAISPDGKWLAQTANPRQIELRELASGEIVVVDLDEAATGPLFFVDE
jgi:hypothetical protein